MHAAVPHPTRNPIGNPVRHPMSAAPLARPAFLTLALTMTLAGCTPSDSPAPRPETSVSSPHTGIPDPGAMMIGTPGTTVAPSQGSAPAPGQAATVAPLPSDTCGAINLQHLIGHPVPGWLDPAGPLRIYATGDAVTMDYNPQRLNVETDRGNPPRVRAITCG